MSKTCLIVILACRFLIVAFGQSASDPESSASTWLWLYQLNIPSDQIHETFSNVIPTADGGYLAFATGPATSSMLKLESGGSIAWQRHYPHSDQKAPVRSLAEVADGYLVLLGDDTELGQLLKLDLSGQLVWRRAYRIGGTELFSSISQDGAGGAILAAGGCLAAIDKDGRPLWAASFGGTEIVDVEAVAGGGFLAAGVHPSEGPSLVRLSPEGEVVWAKALHLGVDGTVFQLSVTPDGGSVLLAGMESYPRYVIRFDADGRIMWAQDYVTALSAVAGFPDGSVLLAAFFGNPTWLARLDVSGNVLWQWGYSIQYDTMIHATAVDSAGMISMVGSQNREGFWVARLDDTGAVAACPLPFHEPTSWMGSAMAVAAVNLAVVAQLQTVEVDERTTEQLNWVATGTRACPGGIPIATVDDSSIEERGFPPQNEITIRLSEKSYWRVSVSYYTEDHDAKAGTDYRELSGTASFEPGQTERRITLQPTDDEVEERDESFSLILTDPVNAMIARGRATVTILDDDSYRTLTVTKEGSGSGTVTSSPEGLDCGSFCAAPFRRWRPVELVAIPDRGSAFVGWSGACTGTESCSVSSGTATSVTAHFHRSFTLGVKKEGYGTVSSEDGAIDCGSVCSADYAPGTIVTLHALPGQDGSFEGWTGACSGTGPCQVTVNDFKAVGATFSTPFETHTLTVRRSGSGKGRLRGCWTSSYCDYDECAALNYPGGSCTLSVEPYPDSIFTGWSGACTGTGTCAITFDSDKSVTANFDLKPPPCAYSLDPASRIVPANQTELSVAVISPTGCAWTASSYAAWLQVVGTGTGQGNGSVSILVQSNDGPARSGMVLVGSVPFSVTQAAGCSIGISTSTASFSEDGGSGAIAVTGACDWRAASQAPWISILGALGATGPGTIEYQVRPNELTTSREGQLTIGDRIFTVGQAAGSCPATVGRPPSVVSPLGGSIRIPITVRSECSWSAESFVPWMTAVRSSGSGSADIEFSVDPYSGGVFRTGAIRINNEQITVTQAGLNTWFSPGPEGASVRQFASSPSNPGILYAAAGRVGVLKSTDGGLSWVTSNNGMTNPDLWKIVVSELDPRLVWTLGPGGFYRSQDGGETWKSLASRYNSTLTVDPHNAGVIYGCSGGLGVAKAADGENFVYFPQAPREAIGVTLDPVKPDVLFAVTERDIYRSTDAGGRWVKVFTTLSPADVFLEAPIAVAGEPGIIYVKASTGVLRSTNGGSSWGWMDLKVMQGSGSAYSFVVDRLNPENLYLRIEDDLWKSTDGGLNWLDMVDPSEAGKTSPLFVTSLPGGHAVLFAGANAGIHRWTESEGWSPRPTYNSSAIAYFVEVDPTDSAVLAFTAAGSFKSIDRGNNWLRDELAPSDGRGLVINSADPKIRYQFKPYASGSSGGLFKSTDGGLTWIQKNRSWVLSNLAIDPANSDHLFASSNYDVFTSSDGGANWERTVSFGLERGKYCFLFRPDEPGVVYAGGPFGLVYRSSDNGSNWVKTGGQFDSYARINQLVNHPTNRSVIYSVTEKGVRKSTDLGANWSSVLDEPSNYLEVDIVNPSRMWAVGRVRKAFYTLDGGFSWCDLTPFDRQLGAFQLDPNDGDNVYTAAYYGGVQVMRTGTECSATLDTSEAAFSSNGGTGTVSVTAAAGCTWSVHSGTSWITVTSAVTGTGNRTVAYQVATNTGAARQAAILIAGRHFVIRQEAGIAPCQYTLPSSQANIEARGGAFWFEVRTLCSAPKPVASEPWIRVYEPSHPGIAFVTYLVAPNSGSGSAPALARTGIITIGDHQFRVDQEGGAELRVAVSGNGSGTIRSSGPGIDCGADCAELFGAMALVSLTATPGPRSVFAGWNGGGCPAEGPCLVTMDGAKTVTATFAHRPPRPRRRGETEGAGRVAPGSGPRSTTLNDSAVSAAFVSVTGNDGGQCSLTGPCRTFARALEVLQSEGEIVALDTGDFGPATITRSTLISSGPGVRVMVSEGDGLTIAAPAETVTIRGLDIVSTGGDNGIKVVSVGTLFVEDCQVSGFSVNGISFEGSEERGKLVLVDTHLIGCTGAGLAVAGDTTTEVVAQSCLFVGNGTGMSISRRTVGTVADSTAEDNNCGFVAANDIAGTECLLSLHDVVVAGNRYGAVATASTGRSAILCSGSTITGNFYGVWTDGLGKVAASEPGTNFVAGNNFDFSGR